jgi:hypothetical protein
MTTYTTNFPVYGTRFRVRWAPSAANKRFFLDDVIVTSASSGGDDIEEFTVAGTSHTFTNLTPETTYYARVKGEADWSDVETFTTLAEPGTAPSWSTLPTPSVVAGSTYELDLTGYVDGDPAPVLTMADTEFDAILIGSAFAFSPTATGTVTFTFTASNGFGTADATLTVTVTGSAPAWSALPAQTIAVGEDCELHLTSYVSGTPTPVISLTTGDDIADFDPSENNYFYFTTPTAGTYTFVFTATNVLGTAIANLTVTVTDGDTPPPASDYEQWLIDNNYPEKPEGTIATNGCSYYENYIADIDPTSTNLLEVSFSTTNSSLLTIDNMSTNRFYQFIYYTNLRSAPITNYLGQGVEGKTLDYPVDDTFFGRIRVLLSAP